MTIKVILAPITSVDTAANVLATAFALGRRFEAHVVALHVRADPRNAMPYMGEGMSGIVLQEIMAAADRDAAERAKAVRSLFDSVVAESGVPVVEALQSPARFSVAWRQDVGREEEIVAKQARLSDVVVVAPQPAKQSAAVGIMMEAALLESGRPVLVSAPQPLESFGANIAVAWNGSAEGSRAVAAAMPFFNAAGRIAVLAVGEDEETETAAVALKQYLGWHGLEAEVAAVRPGPEGVGAAILSETKKRGCDLLVMGAYTHNRFRQMIFGGVTRHVLSEAELPVLVAH
jgi:nucleotide-binding universal stress UspA family protein